MYHLKMFAILGVCGLYLNPFAQTKAAGIEGWDLFKFGMSMEQALQLSRFPLTRFSTEPLGNEGGPGHGGLLGADVEIANVPMRVLILFVNPLYDQEKDIYSGGQLSGFVFDTPDHKPCKEDVLRKAVSERYGQFLSRKVIDKTFGEGSEVASLTQKEIAERTQWRPMDTVTRWLLSETQSIRLSVSYAPGSECSARIVYLDRGYAPKPATPPPLPQSRF
jgi:hypothetical protein